MKNVGVYVVGGLALAGILSLGIYNLITNELFWSATAINVLTLIIAVVLSFYFTQRRAAQGKLIDSVIKVIWKIIEDINSDISLPNEENFDKKRLTILTRSMDNKISYIKKRSEQLKISSEIGKVAGHFEAYETVISNHLEDKNHLCKATAELERSLRLIEDQCYEIIFVLCEK